MTLQTATKGEPTPYRLLYESEAAELLAVSPAWLQRKRWEGAGPAYIRHGRAVRYELTEIEKWIRSHRITPGEGDE